MVGITRQVLALPLVNIGGIDILNGQHKLLLAILWQLMRYNIRGLLQVLQRADTRTELSACVHPFGILRTTTCSYFWVPLSNYLCLAVRQSPTCKSLAISECQFVTIRSAASPSSIMWCSGAYQSLLCIICLCCRYAPLLQGRVLCRVCQDGGGTSQMLS